MEKDYKNCYNGTVINKKGILMNQEEWVNHFEKVNGRKPSVQEVSNALATGEYFLPNNTTKDVTDSTQASGDATEEALIFNEKLKPRRNKALWVVLGIAAAIFIVAVSIGGYYGYRYLSGNIEGSWESKQLRKKLESYAEEKSSDGNYTNYLADNESLYTDFESTMTVKENKVKLVISFVYNREALYKTYNTNVNKTLSDYQETASEDKLSDIILTKEEFYKTVDESLIKELPDSYSYDTETGKVTYVAFEGKVNRIDQTITVTKVDTSNKDDANLAKGDIVYYKASGSHFTLETYDNFKDIVFTKK
ncbi:hypothetical protein [Streptococcus dentiloxodontae]